jgi:hypothetical protein
MVLVCFAAGSSTLVGSFASSLSLEDIDLASLRRW